MLPPRSAKLLASTAIRKQFLFQISHPGWGIVPVTQSWLNLHMAPMSYSNREYFLFCTKAGLRGTGVQSQLLRNWGKRTTSSRTTGLYGEFEASLDNVVRLYLKTKREKRAGCSSIVGCFLERLGSLVSVLNTIREKKKRKQNLMLILGEKELKSWLMQYTTSYSPPSSHLGKANQPRVGQAIALSPPHTTAQAADPRAGERWGQLNTGHRFRAGLPLDTSAQPHLFP